MLLRSSLKDLATYNSNRVAVLLADTVSGSKSACVGLLAGRIATIPVQRSVARVKTGAIGADAMYIGSSSAENGKPDVIHDLGYITARTFLGKAGYYWSDDKLATATTDDYALLPRRRTIDKACRIAYSTLIEELNNEVPTDVDDKIPAPIIKSLQNTVETAIANVMTAEGNLGVDSSNPNDIGVECYIDPNQNILSTSKLIVVLKIKPYGYAKYIDCKLGFLTVNT